ncbi:histone acetyltransferase 1 [Ascosphaera acerosa]|nr:histone acetyltransferase 1 [Ascosphaera acerosa]
MASANSSVPGLTQPAGTCDASSALQLALVQATGEQPARLATVASFAPEYTHAVFGEEESIFGYKGLNITLRFAAHDLRPHVHITYDERFNTVGDTRALDLAETLKPFVVEESFQTLQEYERAVSRDATSDFQPPGSLVDTFTSKGRTFEVWAGTLADPDVRRLFDRIQVVIPLFIDGGQLIETDDVEWTLRRWTIYFLYEKIRPSQPSLPSYSIAGLATTYRWYFYHRQTKSRPQPHEITFPLPHDSDLLSKLPSRLRVAQFLILQPHQGMGLGSHLYKTIQAACLADPAAHELTVEDPNEDFSNLRDANDYRLLRPELDKLHVTINDKPYPPDMRKRPRRMPTAALLPVAELEALRTRRKLTRNQFAHVLEMYLLSQIPPAHRGARTNMTRLLMRKWKAQNEHERRYYWWRLLVKQRLYKKHRDLLIQAEPEERFEALDNTLNTVEDGYEKMLLHLDVREVQIEQGKLAGEEDTTMRDLDKRRPSKRKVVADDDDGSTGDEGEDGARAQAGGPKRTKT